jgi:hypothetical protein
MAGSFSLKLMQRVVEREKPMMDENDFCPAPSWAQP